MSKDEGDWLLVMARDIFLEPIDLILGNRILNDLFHCRISECDTGDVDVLTDDVDRIGTSHTFGIMSHHIGRLVDSL